MTEVRDYIGGGKPVLALDVDGVLLVHDSQPEGYIISPDGNPYVFYKPEHSEWLKEILEHFDAYYLSSHGEHSHEDIGRPLGLNEFDWINFWYFLRFVEDIEQLQMNDLRRLALDSIFPDRPIAWIDDDLQDLEFEWANERTAQGLPTLVIKPESKVGLTEEHIDKIKTWLGERAVSSFFQNNS